MRCAVCGRDNPPLSRFCLECGGRLEVAAQLADQPVRPTPSPQSYTPGHLAERILTSRGALEGERKQVTVLFADLKGSLELLADRDPEEARRLLDPVLERMMEAVHRYEGTVNQVMGDGIMALFGAPLAHEDHAVRACYAALRMQEVVQQYATGLRRADGITAQIRVGLNSGEVVVRSIGSDLQMDYSAIGQTTHLAARMEQLATPGAILLAPATRQQAEGYIRVQALGPVQVRGLRAPVEVYQLLGTGTARTRLQAAAARGLTRFVGREAELETLRRTLDRAGAGHGQLIALVGEPGMGKSRLVWEFVHADQTQGWLVLASGSASYGQATSYLPVIDLLKRYCGIENRDDSRQMREKLTGRLRTLDPALDSTRPALLALLDLPVDDPVWAGLDPAQRKQRTLEALKRLLLRESQEQPLLLVFEDLHWLDTETQALLDSLVDSLPTARLLLLVNYRPEYEHAWHRKTYYQQLRLDPLPATGADELLQTLLGPGAGQAPGSARTADDALLELKDLLIERTEGNPFFLEESVRSLVETGALVGQRGAYRLAKPIMGTQVPATVQAVLATRIDRLEPEAKRLLQAAAVIGKDVPMPLLLAIADVPEQEVRAELARLQAAELLYETRLFPELEYTFKHALTHEVAYQGLLQARRRTLHARIVAAIERLSAERLDEQAERLAHHALRGELWEQAVGYLRQAGLRAMARAASREAITYLEQALEAIDRLPESRQMTELSIDLRLDLRNALVPVGDEARMGDQVREAEVLARKLGDQRRLGRIATFMVIQCLNTGRYDQGVRFGQEALSIGRTLGDRAIEVVGTTFLGRMHTVRGELSAAAILLERNAALAGDLRSERFGSPAIQSAQSGGLLADVLAQLGRFDEAIGQAEAAVRIAEAADHPFSLHGGLHSLGLAHLRRGDLPRATRVLERCVKLCRTWQLVAWTPVVAASLGAAYALAGRADEALPLVAGAVEAFRGRPLHNWPARILLCAATTALSGGRIDEAASQASEALALSRRLGARGSEAEALCLVGDVALTGSGKEAEGSYREALTLADELGIRPLQAHCHLGLGKLHGRAGQLEVACQELTAAIDLLRAMKMTFWLPPAEAALARVAAQLPA
jgi:class 3 adenylate cyclase/tetratricopeptide (TPR) repeat protein